MTHTFKRGDVVTIFRTHQVHGLLIEGKATIMGVVDDVSERYIVCFRGEPSTYYERTVDCEGQKSPYRYQQIFNSRSGYTGLGR